VRTQARIDNFDRFPNARTSTPGIRVAEVPSGGGKSIKRAPGRCSHAATIAIHHRDEIRSSSRSWTEQCDNVMTDELCRI